MIKFKKLNNKMINLTGSSIKIDFEYAIKFLVNNE